MFSFLERGCDVSRVSASDSFTALTADKITGQFFNVASGGRIDVYEFDFFGNPIGDSIGRLLVTYDATTLVLSDFQPSANAPSHQKVLRDGKTGRITGKWKGALVSENALHFDGDKPNSVSGFLRTMIIYLIPLARNARDACAPRDATIPEDLTDRLPFLCSVLHRMGFFVPQPLLAER